jgi:hypothetical protein
MKLDCPKISNKGDAMAMIQSPEAAHTRYRPYLSV